MPKSLSFYLLYLTSHWIIGTARSEMYSTASNYNFTLDIGPNVVNISIDLESFDMQSSNIFLLKDNNLVDNLIKPNISYDVKNKLIILYFKNLTYFDGGAYQIVCNETIVAHISLFIRKCVCLTENNPEREIQFQFPEDMLSIKSGLDIYQNRKKLNNSFNISRKNGFFILIPDTNAIIHGSYVIYKGSFPTYQLDIHRCINHLGTHFIYANHNFMINIYTFYPIGDQISKGIFDKNGWRVSNLNSNILNDSGNLSFIISGQANSTLDDGEYSLVLQGDCYKINLTRKLTPINVGGNNAEGLYLSQNIHILMSSNRLEMFNYNINAEKIYGFRNRYGLFTQYIELEENFSRIFCHKNDTNLLRFSYRLKNNYLILKGTMHALEVTINCTTALASKTYIIDFSNNCAISKKIDNCNFGVKSKAICPSTCKGCVYSSLKTNLIPSKYEFDLNHGYCPFQNQKLDKTNFSIKITLQNVQKMCSTMITYIRYPSRHCWNKPRIAKVPYLQFSYKNGNIIAKQTFGLISDMSHFHGEGPGVLCQGAYIINHDSDCFVAKLIGEKDSKNHTILKHKNRILIVIETKNR